MPKVALTLVIRLFNAAEHHLSPIVEEFEQHLDWQRV